ncbi:anoctamin [Trichonephila clavipes]|nr:anoctamin [Trichonephila clavipes]
MGYIAFYQQDLNMLKWQIAVMMIVNQLFNQFQEAVLPFLLHKYRQKWKTETAASVSPRIKCILEQRDMWSYEEYCEDDALFILPAGLGPVKSRQDELTNCKIREETKRINFNNFFFRTSDCIENDTTMEDDSFRQESPVNTSRETFFFPEFDLNKFSSLESFLECFDKQCLEYQKDEQWKKAKFEWDDDEEFFSSPEKFTPFSSPNQIKRWGLKRKFKGEQKKTRPVTKVDKFIEEMNKHFSDLEDTELIID